MAFLSEADIEQGVLEQLQTLGWITTSDELIGPDGRTPERDSHAEVVLKQRFEEAVTRLNPSLPAEARQEAMRKLLQHELPSLLEENRRLHKLMTEGVDILAAAGIQSPDISILSDEFLAEVQQMDKKNLALEALRKLLNDDIRSRSKSNVVETRAFSERLEDAVARYHANAITTAEVLQELIQLAKDIRAARQRGEESGLSDEEIAFYDALAENDSAVQMMGDDKLKLIAHELLTSLRENVSVDWAHRESARARMRVLVKRILRKYGYPPDLQDEAVQTVLQQAEALSSEWSLHGETL